MTLSIGMRPKSLKWVFSFSKEYILHRNGHRQSNVTTSTTLLNYGLGFFLIMKYVVCDAWHWWVGNKSQTIRLFLDMRCSGVEYHHFVFLIDIGNCILFHHHSYYYTWDVYVHVHSFWTTNVGFLKLDLLVLQLLTSQKVSASRGSFRILDGTYYHRAPLCQSYIITVTL